MSNLADTSLHVSVADFLFHIFCGILGAGGCFFFGGVTLFIIAPIIFGGFGWEWLLLLIGVPFFLMCLCGFILFLYWSIGDLVKGKIEVHGPVTSKREEHVYDEGTRYYLQVREREFKVEGLFYSQVSEGEEVVVIFWSCSEGVIEARKLTEATAHPP